MANWNKKVFTKDERKHMAEMGIISKQDMVNTRKLQAKLTAERNIEGMRGDVCHTCMMIAEKMGIKE